MLLKTTLEDLAETLQLGGNELVSLVGGGGKTTSLFAIGAQLHGRVLLTTTTKMGSERTGEVPVLVNPSVVEVFDSLTESSPLLVWAGVDGRKAIGVEPDLCNTWFASEMIDSVVVEADGSRKRPFKAPLEYEPVVPSSTTLLVACIGSSALGQIIEECCQRPERVAALAGCEVTDRLTPERAAVVLTHDDGSKKLRPSQARFIIAAHRVGSAQQEFVTALAEAVSKIDHTIDVVAVAEEPSALSGSSTNGVRESVLGS